MIEDEKITENPSAFPFNYSEGDGLHEGMTLRDYFAGQAINGILASYAGLRENANIDLCVGRAYQVANAMLKERTIYGKEEHKT